MTRLRRWADDLLLGARLAYSGGRALWGRMTLTAIGIGAGVAVLLLASSVQHMIDERDVRTGARPEGNTSHSTLVRDPTMLAASEYTRIGGDYLSGVLLDVQRPGAPVPAGLSRIPALGEIVVSPALADRMHRPQGQALRDQLSAKVVGVIGEQGLAAPGELLYYKGATGFSAESSRVERIGDRFVPAPRAGSGLNWEMWSFLALGACALLVPVVVFVASTTRLAEAARQRRLSALRLVGAGGRQVRRIASGESLLGALLGVAVGWAFFGIILLILEPTNLLDTTAFIADIRPTWWLAVLVSFGVPIIATITAIHAQRRTIREPLAVQRQTVTRSRGILWRVLPLVLGFGGLLSSASAGNATWYTGLVAMVLIGVACVLPWLLDRVVGRLGGGSLAWQLAVRRLQMTSGAAARSVGAVAVILTGLIASQTALHSANADVPISNDRVPNQELRIGGGALQRGDFETLRRDLGAVPGTDDITSAVYFTVDSANGTSHTASIMDCGELLRVGAAAECADGDVFAAPSRSDEEPVRGGQQWNVVPGLYAPPGPSTAPTWRSPEVLEPLRPVAQPEEGIVRADVVLTPAAAAFVPQQSRRFSAVVKLTEPSPKSVALIRDLAGRHLDSPSVTDRADVNDTRDAPLTVARYGLMAGAVITFALIGCGLLVAAIEQVQERRRFIAVLGAVGVSRGVLGLSVLLQNAVAMLVAVGLALVVGPLLGALVVHQSGVKAVVFDAAGAFTLAALAGISVLVVAMATLPSLARSLDPEGLRSE